MLCVKIELNKLDQKKNKMHYTFGCACGDRSYCICMQIITYWKSNHLLEKLDGFVKGEAKTGHYTVKYVELQKTHHFCGHVKWPILAKNKNTSSHPSSKSPLAFRD